MASKVVPSNNSGFLFRNNFARSPKAPQMIGTITLNGETMRIAAWTRTDKNGNKYQSIRVSPMELGVVPPKGETATVAMSTDKLLDQQFKRGLINEAEYIKAKAVLEVLGEEEKVANVVRKASDAMGEVRDTALRVPAKPVEPASEKTHELDMDELGAGSATMCGLCDHEIAQGEATLWYNEQPCHEECVDVMTNGAAPSDAPSAKKA